MANTQMLYSTVKLDRFRDRQAAFYGRVSTQHEAQLAALGNQMQWYEDQARQHHNWTVVNQYIDEGITGTLAKKRPSFMKMIEDAKMGKFDLIVTREVCRFARNTVDTLVMTRELKNYGVEVYFVEDNIWTMDGDGELRLTIMATLAQEESRKISERVLAGQAVCRENGVLFGNGNIIGYDRANGTYVINEEQAETIRAIFELYAMGYGEKAICNELTVRGCKDGHGNVKWSCVKISRTLRNATYKGYICYNKSRVNNFLEKKRIKNLDEDSFMLVRGNFEPIVSEELWDRCKKIRESRIRERNMPDGEMRRLGSNRPKYLWSRKLQCRCGGNFRRFRWRVIQETGVQIFGYECYRRKRNASKAYLEKHGAEAAEVCDAHSIPEWKLELMAKQIFSRIWGDQKEAVLLVCEMLTQCAKIGPTFIELNSGLEQQIKKLEERLTKYTEMRADGELDKEQYAQMSKDTKAKLKQLKAEQQAAMTPEETSEAAAFDLNAVRQALQQMIDLAQPKIADGVVDEFVETITPVQDYSYRWKLCFGTLKPEYHTNLMSMESKPILSFVIPFETAKEFREENKMDVRFRRSQWNDLHIEVYL